MQLKVCPGRFTLVGLQQVNVAQCFDIKLSSGAALVDVTWQPICAVQYHGRTLHHIFLCTRGVVH